MKIISLHFIEVYKQSKSFNGSKWTTFLSPSKQFFALQFFSVPPFAFEVDVMMNVIRCDMFPPGKLATRYCVLSVLDLCLALVMCQLHDAKVDAKNVNRFLIRGTN